MSKHAPLIIGTFLLVASPAYYLYGSRGHQDSQGALRVADHYLKATYARDFRKAYRWLSDQDRLAKDENSYSRERGSFTGFTARLAARLAGFIDGRPIETTATASNAAIRLKLRVPDPDKLSAELLEWDEERLNALSFTEQSALLAKIHRMHATGKLPFIKAEETLALVKEKGSWKIRLEPQESVRVQILIKLPNGAPLVVDSETKDISFKPGKPFNVRLKVRNSSATQLWASVGHNVKPDFLAKYMGLGNCGTFVPFRLSPGAMRESSDTFLVWTDLPADTKQFTMIYEFKIEEL
ncbi:MAG: cytochrome c oxidase assembly protein [Deltaproteobacteria bacterium]|nr:cytochrome c oxidase assembly protein [Deltaproteobacteria bacterium]